MVIGDAVGWVITIHYVEARWALRFASCSLLEIEADLFSIGWVCFSSTLRWCSSSQACILSLQRLRDNPPSDPRNAAVANAVANLASSIGRWEMNQQRTYYSFGRFGFHRCLAFLTPFLFFIQCPVGYCLDREAVHLQRALTAKCSCDSVLLCIVA